MPSKKGTRKNINKRITAKLYKFPKAFLRKTNKKKAKSKSKSPSPNECPICLEPFTPNNLAILDCGHKFHFRCILKDVTKSTANKKCPLCRVRVDTSPSQRPVSPQSQRLHQVVEGMGLQIYDIEGVTYYLEPDERMLYDTRLNYVGDLDEDGNLV